MEWNYRTSISSISHLFFNSECVRILMFHLYGIIFFLEVAFIALVFFCSLVFAPLYRLCEHLVECHLFSGSLLLRLALPPPGLVGPAREINFQNGTKLQKFSFHSPKG